MIILIKGSWTYMLHLLCN